MLKCKYCILLYNLLIKVPEHINLKAQDQPCLNTKIRWCISDNLEVKKCEYLKTVAEALNLEPRFKCIKKSDRDSSLLAVSRGECDVFVSKPHERHHLKKCVLLHIIYLTQCAIFKNLYLYLT